jgi:hypothetical protein
MSKRPFGRRQLVQASRRAVPRRCKPRPWSYWQRVRNGYLRGCHQHRDHYLGLGWARRVFVAKWSPATGALVWAQRAGDAGVGYHNALAMSGISVYVAGAFNSATAAFGTQNLVSVAPAPAGFFATLNDATNLAVATPTTLAGVELYPNPAGRAARYPSVLAWLPSRCLMP